MASFIEGNATTATRVSSGIGASFKVASVMIPSVPSAPTKSDVRLYPAEDFLDAYQRDKNRARCDMDKPRSVAGFHDCPISQHNCQVHHPVFHGTVPHGIGTTA